MYDYIDLIQNENHFFVLFHTLTSVPFRIDLTVGQYGLGKKEIRSLLLIGEMQLDRSNVSNIRI